MRWFKHMTGSGQDEKLMMLKAEFGMEGYGVYWSILELIGAQINKTKNQTFLRFPVKIWKKITGLQPKKFQNFTKYCQESGLFLVTVEKDMVTFDCPNILKYKDEYSRKSGHNQDEAGTGSGATPEEETEAEQDTEPKGQQATIWDSWLSIPGVVAKGEAQARSHLGKLIKQYGELPVAQAVAVVAITKPADPHSFIEGQLKANPKTGKRPDWALIPREDNELWPWAKRHNYSDPGGLDYFQYRRKLQNEVEMRLNQ